MVATKEELTQVNRAKYDGLVRVRMSRMCPIARMNCFDQCVCWIDGDYNDRGVKAPSCSNKLIGAS